MMAAHLKDGHPIMHINKLLLVGTAVAGVLALLLVSGCGNNQDQASAPAKTTVGTKIDDAVVTSKVKSALFADPEIKSFDLKVETRKGEVQLSGFVDSQTQIDRALSTTRGVEGVSGIENRVTLKEGKATIGSTVDDGIITTKVKSALLADPGVKSFDIAVVTRTGVVQLSGFVDSQVQMDQAIALAGKVEGVASVGNEMSIKQ
jgi:hyperosmotically inducible protein